MSDYARGVILSILKEEAVRTDVVDAIKNKYEVVITYGDGADGERRIQPVAYGKTMKGNLVLRAYQTDGDSNTRPNGWKFFLLDKIGEWNPEKDRHFTEPRDGVNGAFNPDGDEKMSEVYLVADFGDGSGGEYETSASEPVRRHAADVGRTVDTDISGIGRQEVSDGNMQSISDMSKATAFGGGKDMQTSGPVRKGNVQTRPEDDGSNGGTEAGDYTPAMSNGPLYKGDTGQGEETSDEDNINNMDFVDDFGEDEENF